MTDEKITEFEFDLFFALPRNDVDQDVIVDALFEAGCDDAVIGLGAQGLVGLGFARGGEDAEEVIADAVKAALSALPEGTKLRKVKPNLVNQGVAASTPRFPPSGSKV